MRACDTRNEQNQRSPFQSFSSIRRHFLVYLYSFGNLKVRRSRICGKVVARQRWDDTAAADRWLGEKCARNRERKEKCTHFLGWEEKYLILLFYYINDTHTQSRTQTHTHTHANKLATGLQKQVIFSVVFDLWLLFDSTSILSVFFVHFVRVPFLFLSLNSI